MTPSHPTSRRRALLTCAFTATTAVACALLLAAAALVPAPPAVIPLIALVCVGCPMLAAWHLPAALAALDRSDERAALADMRRRLEALPETSHPLGL